MSSVFQVLVSARDLPAKRFWAALGKFLIGVRIRCLQRPGNPFFDGAAAIHREGYPGKSLNAIGSNEATTMFPCFAPKRPCVANNPWLSGLQSTIGRS